MKIFALLLSLAPSLVLAQLDPALCVSETAMLAANEALTAATAALASAIESDVTSNFLTFCDFLDLECEVDVDDYSADFETACTTAGGQVVTRDADFSCTGAVSGIPIPAGLTFGLDDWPICVSTSCDPLALPAEVEQGLSDGVNAAIDGVEEALGGSITCDLISGSAVSTTGSPEGTTDVPDTTAPEGATDMPDTTAPEGTTDMPDTTAPEGTTEVPTTTEEAGTGEPLDTSTPAEGIPGADEAACINETANLVADPSIVAARASMVTAIEANVTNDFLGYCNLLELECDINVDEFSAEFVSACTAANGQIVDDDVDFACTGAVSGIPIPTGLTIGVDNWPICVGISCDGLNLPTEVVEGIDEAVGAIIDEIEAGLGGTVMCEITMGGTDTSAPSSGGEMTPAPEPTTSPPVDGPTDAPIDEPSDAPAETPTEAPLTPFPTTSSAVVVAVGAIGALLPSGALVLLGFF